ncbi:polysaccharide pyruvyl transferase family protein [Mycolicibacterium sp. XJ662]
MKIGIASGFWSQNIGNAFFQLGGAHMLRRAVPGVEVVRVPDAAGNWTLRNKATGNPKQAFDLTAHVSGLDYLVIQGPSLTWYVDQFWNSTIRDLRRNGTRIILNGIAFYRFDKREIDATSRFLAAADPVCIITRDSRSYEQLRSMQGVGDTLFDGIDSAFWTPFETVPDLSVEPFVCVTFDRYVEPRWCQNDQSEGSRITLPNGRRLAWSTDHKLNRIASRGKGVAYVSAVVDRFKRRPSELGGYTVVRPEHRSNPPMHWKSYGSPNGYMADEPWSYLALYKSAEATLSDRVHACVAAMAHGRPAMLFNSSPRGSLVERVAGTSIRSELVQVPLEKLDALRADQESFIANIL